MKIATSKTARSRVWRNTETTWEKLSEKLRSPKVLPFTLKEYLAKPKAEQATLKDVGGYVGGYLTDGSRKIDKVATRELLTLDIDNDPATDLIERIEALGINAVLHSTFKSTEKKPRYRVIAPLDKPATPEQYQAIARWIAGELGIEQFDPTTFEPHRLMYWPAKPTDTEYLFKEFKHRDTLSVEDTLAEYYDWRDTSEWPMHESIKNKVQTNIKRLEDPTTKRGVIGAFCRAYNIHDAIAEYLSDVYTPTADPNRYTYAAGETAAGLIVYNDLWAYSHHGTDPISGKECNAFDLVRIHLYADQDTDAPDNTSVTALPSYKAMQQRASEDSNVKHLILEERRVTSDDFEIDDADTEAPEFNEEEYNREWRSRLTYKPKSTQVEPTTMNARLILTHDLRLRGAFRHNLFSNKISVTRDVPWHAHFRDRSLDSSDHPELRCYLEEMYGFRNDGITKDALVSVSRRFAYHPIKDYLESLKWDGIKRVENMLVEHFAAPDNLFTRAAIRKTLCAAVARVYEPGIKFDYMLVLSGGQAAGKSTFASRLCYKNVEWFTDNFGYSAKDNKMAEAIRGKWIVEMSEMTGWRKAEVSEMKQFISRQVDEYRGAYKEESDYLPRQCVFIASTNEDEFLYDPTGDRRYWPIAVDKKNIKRFAWTIPDEEIDQIWAEAKQLYDAGEPLYLSPREEILAKEAQDNYTVRDTRLGTVDNYLEIEIPERWHRMELIDRRQWIEEHSRPADEWTDTTTPTKQRETVCIAEIWCECFKKPRDEMNKSNTRDINDMMRAHPGWEYIPKAARFGDYGVQRYYKRIKVEEL